MEHVRLPGQGPPLSPHGKLICARLRDSCESCARAKVKCPKQRPACSKCLARGLECHYYFAKRTGRSREGGLDYQVSCSDMKSNRRHDSGPDSSTPKPHAVRPPLAPMDIQTLPRTHVESDGETGMAAKVPSLSVKIPCDCVVHALVVLSNMGNKDGDDYHTETDRGNNAAPTQRVLDRHESIVKEVHGILRCQSCRLDGFLSIVVAMIVLKILGQFVAASSEPHDGLDEDVTKHLAESIASCSKGTHGECNQSPQQLALDELLRMQGLACGIPKAPPTADPWQADTSLRALTEIVIDRLRVK